VALVVNVYVFPGKDGTGSPVEPKRRIARVNEVGNVVFTLHDLHRTFATIAEGLDITGYTLKRLLDHSIHGDVTAGYGVTDAYLFGDPFMRLQVGLCVRPAQQGRGVPRCQRRWSTPEQWRETTGSSAWGRR
jgi:integrase